MEETLEFSCAAAALNCTAPGARGGIASLEQIAGLRAGAKRFEPAYSTEVLAEASRAATASTGAKP